MFTEMSVNGAKLLLLSFMVALISAGANAAEKEFLSLDSLIEQLRQQNLEIEMAKQKYEAAKNRIPQSRSLDDPRFDFRYDKMTASMDAVMEGKTAPMRVYGVTQEIPFPTKLFLNAQIAGREAQMAYQNYREKEKAVIAKLKTFYAQLALIYKSQEITLENKTLLEQLAKTAATQYSLGKASQQDALKAQLEISRMDNELVMLEQERRITQAKINILLNQDTSTELGYPQYNDNIFADYNLGTLNQLARDNRPELKAFRLAVERAEKTYLLARHEYLPDFMLRYERMTRDNNLTDWAGMVGVTVPLWFWQKQNFNVREMKSELKMFEAEFKQQQNMALLEVKEAFTRLEASKQLALLYKTAYLPQAEQALKASLTGYESDQIDFLNLLDSQRMLLEFKLDYYKAIIEGEVAKAELEKAIGVEEIENAK